MANKGGQPGNDNGRKAKIWSDALRKAVIDKDHKKLRKIANVLVQKALDGDMAALKELGDRLEGKPIQAIEGTGDDGELALTLKIDYVGTDSGTPGKT